MIRVFKLGWLILLLFVGISRTHGSRERASWYHLPGRHTASGKLYSNNRNEFASRHMPFGTIVKITYKGKSAIAICTDRGPFVKGRSIDLNKKTAKALGFTGVGLVDIKVIGKPK